MAKTPRAWTALDQEAMSYIAALKDRDPRRLSLRAMGDLTGISHSRIADLLKGRMGSPSLQEFTTLCLLFGERPSTVLERVMQTIEKEEPTPSIDPTALADMDPDALADLIAADPDAYDIAALRDPNKDLERETPRD